MILFPIISYEIYYEYSKLKSLNAGHKNKHHVEKLIREAKTKLKTTSIREYELKLSPVLYRLRYAQHNEIYLASPLVKHIVYASSGLL